MGLFLDFKRTPPSPPNVGHSLTLRYLVPNTLLPSCQHYGLRLPTQSIVVPLDSFDHLGIHTGETYKDTLSQVDPRQKMERHKEYLLSTYSFVF